MNYCISGKSGFIGRAISGYLIERGDLVYGIPRDLSIEELRAFFRLKQPDCIIHLATYGNHYDKQQDYKQMIETNIIGTYNLLEASIGCKKVYNITASVVSGEFYYSTKYCAEVLAEKYGAINARIYSAYGPGEADHKFIPTVINRLNTGRQMILDERASHAWIYIDDLVRLFFAGETELGGSHKITNIEVVRLLEVISGKVLNYIPGKVRNYDNDNWQAPKTECETSLFNGLRSTYEYYTI